MIDSDFNANYLQLFLISFLFFIFLSIIYISYILYRDFEMMFQQERINKGNDISCNTQISGRLFYK